MIDLHPRLIIMGITNFYNPSMTIVTVNMIRSSTAKEAMIIVGWRTFQRNPNTYSTVMADAQMGSYAELERAFGGL